MTHYILAFLLGDIYLQTFRTLPAPGLAGCLALASLVLGVVLRRLRYSFMPFVFALGFAWSVWYAHAVLSWTLAKERETKPLLVRGTIVSLPVEQQFGTRFIFLTEEGSARLSLNNQDTGLALRVGDKWEFLLRLKRIHGVQSPGAFDYEAWGLQNGIRAAGYVVKSPENRLLKHDWRDYPWQRLREHLKAQIQAQTANPSLLALMLGERQGFTQADWQVLRKTGTNHLMAIAGLHIGIVAWLMHGVTLWVWRRHARWMLYLPAPHAGAIAALLAAIIYSALAGFSLPTARACVMLCVYTYTLLRRGSTNSWHIWSLTLLILLLQNPLSVLSESFWLSLGTIALIIYGMQGRFAPGGLWWRWGRVQFVIALGLVPLSLLLFQEISLISFIANCVAIPWLSLVLPLCLLSMPFLLLYPAASCALLFCADKLITGLWFFLSWLANLPAASVQFAVPNSLIFLLLAAGVLLLLAPPGIPGKYLGLLWLLPLFTYHYPRPANREAVLSLLDVGQGLSAVVQTEHHLLVYDAGPAVFNQSNMGESVVLPYLRSIGIKQIDMLVISHGDNDHIGGARALIDALPVLSVKTSVPDKIRTPVTDFCRSGMTWTWDGVNFAFIYPHHAPVKAKNDDSCVLRVDAGKSSILLPGDIEKSAEKQLIVTNRELLKSTILIAPHHGSKTSALPGFVSSVRPEYVLYATGYFNRYHFPSPRVVDAYASLNAMQFNTAETGTIRVEIKKSHNLLNMQLYRQTYRHYWTQ